MNQLSLKKLSLKNMYNVAEVYNDGTNVYFNSAVIIKKSTRFILIVINLIVLCFYFLLLFSFIKEGLTRGIIVSFFIIIPILYSATLGKSLLWNLYGREHIIISTSSISHSRNYGYFTTPLKVIPYRQLRYKISSEKKDLNLSTIDFIDNTVMGVPTIIFSSSVYVPTAKLNELIEQLVVVFAIENLTGGGDNFIHLN